MSVTTPLHFANKREFDEWFVQHGHELQGACLHLVTLHDDACTPGVCLCEPEYVLEDGTDDNITAGAKAEDAWRRAKTS